MELLDQCKFVTLRSLLAWICGNDSCNFYKSNLVTDSSALPQIKDNLSPPPPQLVLRL